MNNETHYRKKSAKAILNAKPNRPAKGSLLYQTCIEAMEEHSAPLKKRIEELEEHKKESQQWEIDLFHERANNEKLEENIVALEKQIETLKDIASMYDELKRNTNQ